MADNYGLYKTVPQVTAELDSTSAEITLGTMMTKSGATNGYHKEVDAAAEAVSGVALSAAASPSADGGAEVEMCVDLNAIFVYPPDAGSVTQALKGTLVDAGADGRSIDIDGSTTQDVLIVDVDVAANLCYVRFLNLGQ